MSCGYCPAFRINLGPVSVESQLSCAILIHNFLPHVARCQDTHSSSTRLRGGGEGVENYGGRKGVRDALSSQSSPVVPSLHRMGRASQPHSRPGIQLGLNWEDVLWSGGRDTPSDVGFGTGTWRRQRTMPTFF